MNRLVRSLTSGSVGAVEDCRVGEDFGVLHEGLDLIEAGGSIQLGGLSLAA